MARSQITAAVLPASGVLNPGTAPTITVPQQFVDDLAAALNNAYFTHGTSAASKQYWLQQTVLREIAFLLADRETAFQYWPEINKSQPVGNVWNTSTTNYFAHPRLNGSVVAWSPSVGNYRYLIISIPI